MDVNMAMRILDKNETGEIDFGEFVKWYKDGVKLPDTMTASKSGADDLEDIDPNTRIDEITG
jgi:Ca2+-binding EF-hand superfamily protein